MIPASGISNLSIFEKIYDMPQKELIEEINKVLNNAPAEILESILNYLKELMSRSEPDAKLSNNLNRILHEDKEVLEKLAK